MNWGEAAEKILIKLLGDLGFQVEVERVENEEECGLNVKTTDSKYLIGKDGDRLEDLQYLVNRVLQKHYPDAPRVKIDCDGYRQKQELQLVEKARELAGKVLESGKVIRTRPLNAYYRRIVYNALLDSPVITSSPKSAARYKRIEIKPAS